MKTTKQIILLSMLIFAGYSCQDKPVLSGNITMTTQKNGEMFISITGSGSITIDWGDGTPLEKHILSEQHSNYYKHKYSITSVRAVTITGENITHLGCLNQQLTSLDISKSVSLIHLDCSNNQLTSLDISKSVSLIHLNCSNNQLTSLDMSKNNKLTWLYCSWNPLTNLDVSKNAALITLYCYDNQLTNLDVSKNTILTNLYCGFNRLTNLDVSKNIALKGFGCDFNKLTNLDVSKNIALTGLSCASNQITSLDVSKNTALTYLNCQFCDLSATALNNLFETLHNRYIEYGKTINVVYNPGAMPGEESCDKSIATNKGWIFDDWIPI